MEILKIESNVAKREKGIIQTFLVPEVCSMDCGDVLFDEYKNHYEVLGVQEEKLNQLDLSSILFYFIKSPYFDEKKDFFLGKKSFHFKKRAQYDEVFQKISPVF